MDDEEWRKQALAAETARVEKLHLETKAAMEEMAISDDEIEMLVSRFENDEGELDIDLLHQLKVRDIIIDALFPQLTIPIPLCHLLKYLSLLVLKY